MCGIMGYIGDKQAAPILMDGLRRLEYRGYDSTGIAIYRDSELVVARAKGKIRELEKRVSKQDLKGTIGIGHTRWATHGKPSDENAHPHRSEHVVVIHNGIIENHLELRGRLLEAGFSFQSETDTEVIPLLIELYLRKNQSLEKAVQNMIVEVQGAFSLAIISSKEPDKIIAAKNSSPLIVGLGKGENFVASDIPALLTHTRDVIVMEDGQIAVVEKDRYSFTDFQGNPIERKPKHITWSRVMAEKAGYKHFMLKEIFEQPQAVTDTLRGRVIESKSEIVLDEVQLPKTDEISRMVITACGTSWHAALVAKCWIESLARIPVEVDVASEYRYRQPIVDSKTLFVTISQSGETADTLAALEEAKKAKAHIFSICNVIDSSIARKSNSVVYTHAGPEIGVASTKAFTTQLTVLAMLALYLAKEKGTMDSSEWKSYLHSLVSLPGMIERALKLSESTEKIARDLHHTHHFLYLGRGASYPIALEGALKLKEISYIHAEGYSGGEMKHGPIALIDEDMPVLALMGGKATYPKILSNMEEVRARGGRVIAVAQEGDPNADKVSEMKIQIPKVNDFVRPIVEVIPLQLLAYHFADLRGTDVDQPRNLAKSVTVE